jgi:phosphatidylserine decarboxylase
MDFLRFIPKAYLSWFVGHLIRLPLPAPLARLSIRVFAKLYSIEPSMATLPLSGYRCIGDFFIRDLRLELRPIAGPIVCPVDGKLRSCADLDAEGDVTQVKGVSYKIADLLGNDPLTERFRQGQLWNFYLSPQDAHHIHSPVDGRIVKTIHLPGALWPVNDWALHSIPGLFAVNERVVTFIESDLGLVAVVMVGATNVGRIKLSYLDVETNKAPWKRSSPRTFEHSSPIDIARGAKLGTFKMGSSVILVTERRLAPMDLYEAGIKVRYGSCLNELTGTPA